MCWSIQHRRLPALTVFAALALAYPSAFSQAPAQTEPAITAPASTPTLYQIESQPPAALQMLPADASQPRPEVVAQQPPPTPEEMGDSLMSHQRYQAAIESYKKGPLDSAALWNKMGIAYQLMLNSEEASHCYRASLRLDPKDPHVLNNLGTIYDSQKEYNNAERMYRKAIKVDPASAMIYKNLGTNLLAQRKYKKGWEAYKTALEIDPQVFQNNSSPRVQNPASVQERGAMNFYMAKGCLRAGMNECAIDYLRLALNEGFTSPKKIEADSEFAGLRGLAAFQQLLSEQKQQ